MAFPRSARVAAIAIVSAICVIGLLAAAGVMAASEGRRPMLGVGEKVPDVTFADPLPARGEGKEIRISDYKGKKNVLVAFYPKAFTPECTKQMCGYRDSIDAFRAADTEVIGVSLDTLEKSAEFKKKHNLPFLVAADPDGEIAEAFGVPVTNLFIVRFAKRCVFLIDKAGIVRYVNRSYRVSRDAAPLLDEIRKLNAGETGR